MLFGLVKTDSGLDIHLSQFDIKQYRRRSIEALD